jgi:hypothetical protein
MGSEQEARAEIDRLLAAAGWRVQDAKAANIHASLGVATSEVQGRYAKYLANFDRAFSVFQNQIRQELSSQWAQELAPKLGCKRASLAMPEFRRKVFDNLLVRVGRRKAARQVHH